MVASPARATQRPSPAAPTVVAAAAPSAPKPAAGAGAPDPRLIEAIFACLSPGLPNEWRRAWIVLSDAGPGRPPDAKFFYSTRASDDRGEPLEPCNARELAERIVALNELLPPEKRRWREARLTIALDGSYELKYEYAP
ncbi:MAG: hypothetical protein N2653_14405 [Burkholderiales bacterium]|nr:hypothetical protein [Burkholderiales bacterium]